MYQNININYYYDNEWGKALYLECCKREPRNIMEIGNESSFTTLVFAQAIKDSVFFGSIESFDVNNYNRKTFWKEYLRLDCAGVVVNFKFGKCPDLFSFVNLDSYDLIYIDINNNADKILQVVQNNAVCKWINDGGTIIFEGGQSLSPGQVGHDREKIHFPPISALKQHGIDYKVICNHFPGFSVIDKESIRNYVVNK